VEKEIKDLEVQEVQAQEVAEVAEAKEARKNPVKFNKASQEVAEVAEVAEAPKKVGLTASELHKKVAKLADRTEFTVTIGEDEYTLEHDVVFRKTKIQKVLEDMLEFFNAIGEENKHLLELATPYTALLIIKHFTSLDVPNDIDEALILLEVLIDLEALGVIVNELPEKEVLKVYEVLALTIENAKANLDEAEKQAVELAGQIENPEVKEMIEGNGE
jgi:DNA-binding Lrp family transcriptional regulator